VYFRPTGSLSHLTESCGGNRPGAAVQRWKKEVGEGAFGEQAAGTQRNAQAKAKAKAKARAEVKQPAWAGLGGFGCACGRDL
jgi:hypothetical protein